MKHNYFHYCISVQQGKGRGTASAEERNQERWQSRGQGRPRKTGEGRTHEIKKIKKDRKAFYARKSTQRKLTELAKNVQPFRNSEACLLRVQTSSGCISINLYSADKKS